MVSYNYNVGDMISTHTLARHIITGHNTPNAVLDSDELSLLQRFCLDPSSSSHLLESQDISHDAPKNGSLVTFCITSHNTPSPCLTSSEITLLKNWFQSRDVDITAGAGPMIRSHTVAYNIIQRPHEIFDAESIESMKRFCLDGKVEPKEGSLVWYCAEKGLLSEDEIGLLKEWFEKGGPIAE